MRATISGLPPVFIPSKGRPNGKTMQLLKGSMVPYTVFVEPQDAAAYADAGHPIQELPDNDRGIAYVSQRILDWARMHEFEWYWLLDDDLTGLFEVVNKRCVRVTALGALVSATGYFKDLKEIGQAALEFRQYAWAAEGDYRLDTGCQVVTAIRSSVMADYDPRFVLKQDQDFTLQVLQEGYRTMKVSRFAFDTGYMGAREGGLQSVYHEGLEEEMSRLLERKWPTCATARIKKDGRWDAKIDWRYFDKQRARRASA